MRERQYETCADCPELPCERLDGLDESDSFVTHRNAFENLRSIRDGGIDNLIALQEQRVALLRTMLAEFDDGRSKSHFCVACTLLPIDELGAAVNAAITEIDQAGISREDRKNRAALLRQKIQTVAERLGVDLRLRRP